MSRLVSGRGAGPIPARVRFQGTDDMGVRGREIVGLVIAMALIALRPPPSALRPSLAEGQDYVVGARDILLITVVGQEQLTGKYAVSTDGVLMFPFIGEVKAAGLTELQLGEKIKELLGKDYLVDPQVLVSVAEYKSKKVAVLGEVKKPGLYPLTGETTILEIISQAGPTADAGKQVVLVRPRQKVASAGVADAAIGNTIRRLSLQKIQSADSSENIPVEDGDTIFMPKVNSFFVLGEVAKAGAYPLEKEMNILEAVSLAGGFKEKAQASGTVVLRRRSDGTQDTIPVDLSGEVPANRYFVLHDGDTVIVPRGNQFFVLGEVKKPGNYLLEKNTTILEAITIANGFTERAAPSKTKVIRKTPKGEQVIQVDMNEVIKKGRREKSIPIQENDVIVVPESFF